MILMIRAIRAIRAKPFVAFGGCGVRPLRCFHSPDPPTRLRKVKEKEMRALNNDLSSCGCLSADCLLLDRCLSHGPLPSTLVSDFATFAGESLVMNARSFNSTTRVSRNVKMRAMVNLRSFFCGQAHIQSGPRAFLPGGAA